MDKRQRLIVAIFGGILVVALIMLTALLLTKEPDVIISDFEAPPFDEGVVLGVPEEIVARSDYQDGTVEGGFSFSICGAPVYENGYLYPYFASHGDNEVWLLIKVYGADGTEIGKSGLIRPGECIPSVALSSAPMGNEIRVRIFSYESDTYLSRGSVSATLALLQN